MKEAILSYQIERRFTKDEILEMYLNQIFFGNTAYGLAAAAKEYFHKAVGDLSVGEAAMLAGLPKAPSQYSPIRNRSLADRRQRYVLRRMVEAGFLTQEAGEKALREEIRVYPAQSNNIYHAPFFAAEVRRWVLETWRDISLDRDGLQITTTLDLGMQEASDSAVRRGLRIVDKRRGWRGPVELLEPEVSLFRTRYGKTELGEVVASEPFYVLVLSVDRARHKAKFSSGSFEGEVDLTPAWATRRISPDDRVIPVVVDQVIKPGHVIEISQEASEEATRFVLDQTPELEGALMISEPSTGEVRAMVGGYSYRRSQFNRVTQSLRQPGSAFKPIVYLSAVDGFDYTPATIVHDTPRTFRVGDETWTPGNFDESFLGPITLRNALEKSRNLVSADIISRIGVDPVIQYARRLGVTSPLGRNLSLSLGSSEVTLLELVRAYGVFAAKGVLVDTALVSRVLNREGEVIYDIEHERLSRAHQVIRPSSAFIMANMMKGVIESGTGTRVKALKRPVAGKTGTSNDQMDAWFVGYTPSLVCGVWAGFDTKRQIGDKQTGGVVAAPIFLDAMKTILDDADARAVGDLNSEAQAEAQRLGIEFTPHEAPPPLDFSVPDGVEPIWINKTTGTRVEPGSQGAFLEYFLKGTEPSTGSGGETKVESYLNSPDL